MGKDAPTVPSLATSAKEEFTRVSMWFANNGLVLNRNKSLYVHFMYSSVPDYSLLKPKIFIARISGASTDSRSNSVQDIFRESAFECNVVHFIEFSRCTFCATNTRLTHNEFSFHSSLVSTKVVNSEYTDKYNGKQQMPKGGN
nr:unnamed protein product [Callosobruchus chinensis]